MQIPGSDFVRRVNRDYEVAPDATHPVVDVRRIVFAEPPNPWLKPSEYARRSGVTRQTVWNWARKGLVQVRRMSTRTGVLMRTAPRFATSK